MHMRMRPQEHVFVNAPSAYKSVLVIRVLVFLFLGDMLAGANDATIEGQTFVQDRLHLHLSFNR